MLLSLPDRSQYRKDDAIIWMNNRRKGAILEKVALRDWQLLTFIVSHVILGSKLSGVKTYEQQP